MSHYRPLRMLAIDECRIRYASEADYAATVAEQSGPRSWKKVKTATTNIDLPPTGSISAVPAGRWPANVVLTDPIFDGGVEGVVGGGMASPGTAAGVKGSSGFADGYDGEYTVPYGDSGTYSRFFIIPKAARSEREPTLPSGIEARREMAHRKTGPMDTPYLRGETFRVNAHPTVKPTDLMRHLVRLVTPSGGTVLDPFLGSGTTGLACELEGFPWIGIEKEAEYVQIAEARLNGTQRGIGL